MPRVPKAEHAVMTLRVPQTLMDAFDAATGDRDRTACIKDAMTAWIFVQQAMGGADAPAPVPHSPIQAHGDALEQLLEQAGELYCDHVPVDGVCAECGELVA